MTKRTGFFLLGIIAAVAALVVVLGLSGAPEDVPAPQYTAEEVEAHYLKQLEAARRAELEREAQAAREVQARAEVEAARAAEENRLAEAALAAEQAERAERERPAQVAEEAPAGPVVADPAPNAPTAPEPPTSTATAAVPETAAVTEAKPDGGSPVAAEELPGVSNLDPTTAAEQPPSVAEPAPVPVTELPVADLPVAAETPAVTEAPTSHTPVVAEAPAVVENASKPVPTAPPEREPEPKPVPVLKKPESPAKGPKTVAAKPVATPARKTTASNKPSIPKTSTRGVTVSGAATRPRFPWPPPQASTVVRLPLSRFDDTLTRRIHGEVADLLEGALDQGGYFDRSFWVAPGGFALATRLERISEDGLAVQTDARWPTSSLKERFDLGRYLRALFYTDPGYFRVIVFVLSTEFERTSDEEPTPKEAFRWLRRGMVMLPRDMAEQDLTDRHELTALIYEFEREAGSDAIVLAPGRLTGRTHLAQAKLQRLLGAE